MSPVRFIAVVEAAADYLVAHTLADRVWVERGAPWLVDFADQLDLLRTWVGPDAQAPYLTWTRAKRLARENNVPSHGHFGGQPGAADALAARKALRLVALTLPELEAVVLLRDADGDDSRARGLEQAREEASRGLSFAIAIGVARQKREAWILNGFVADNEAEETRLQELRRRLGFSPCEAPEELTASGNKPEAKRNAKGVLDELTGGDPDREARCLSEPRLEDLETRGRGSGLAAFLEDLAAHPPRVFRFGPPANGTTARNRRDGQ